MYTEKAHESCILKVESCVGKNFFDRIMSRFIVIQFKVNL